VSGLHVTVRCFSQVRHALGRDELPLELPAGATAAAARAAVVALAPGPLSGLPMRIAVNEAFVDDAHALADGDEVVLIPPVQGG